MQEIIDNFSDEEDIINEIVRRYPDVEERRLAINTPRDCGYTILTFALSQHTFSGELVRFLLHSGSDPNHMSNIGTHTISFHSANEPVALRNMMLLLAYGADPKNGDVLSMHTWADQVNFIHLLLLHEVRMGAHDIEILRDHHIISDFYNRVTLRSMALHHIILHQLRLQ